MMTSNSARVTSDARALFRCANCDWIMITRDALHEVLGFFIGEPPINPLEPLWRSRPALTRRKKNGTAKHAKWQRCLTAGIEQQAEMQAPGFQIIQPLRLMNLIDCLGDLNSTSTPCSTSRYSLFPTTIPGTPFRARGAQSAHSR